MKKISAYLSAAALAAYCFSGAALSPAADDGSDFLRYEPTEDNVRILGRTNYNGESLQFGLSCSGVEFSFTGTTAKITISGDNGSVNVGYYGARIGFYLDGVRVKDAMLNEDTHTYTIEADEEGEHVVKVLKLSESAQGSILIDDIAVDGGTGIYPTEEPSHSIEFIGDSITCGYGIDCESASEGFSTSTEDGSRTYAYKAASLFGADASLVAFSGYGVLSGYGSTSAPNTTNLISNVYEKTGYTWAWLNGETFGDVMWDFPEEDEPDLVVINLGTNDYSYTSTDAEKGQAFADAYVDFLKTVREKNPDAEILCTLGIMGDELYDYIEIAAETYTEETGDDKINTLRFSLQDSDANGYGGDYHPTEASQETAAYELAAAIEEYYGWEIDDTVSIATTEKLSPVIEENNGGTTSGYAYGDGTVSGSSSSDGGTSENSSSDESSDSDESSSNVSSSGASSSGTSSSSDSNPDTGTALGAAAAAAVLLGAAVVMKRSRRNG